MSETLEHSDIPKGYKEVHLGPKPTIIPSEWEVRTLDELTHNSGSYGANISAVDYDPEKPRYIRITDIGEDGFLKNDDRKSISRDDAEGYYVSAGDLLFARTGATAGKSFLCKNDETDAAYAGYLIRFELDESLVDTTFIALYVQSKLYHDWVDRITRHGAQQNINASEYRSLGVLCPPIPEQRRIATIISKVDDQIQQTAKIIGEAEALKKGIRQDLVVGKGLSRETKQIRLGAKTEEIPSSWDIKKFSQVATVEKGNTPKTSNSEYYGGDVVWVTPDDLSELYERGEKYISDSKRKLTEAGLESTSVNVVPAPSVMFTSRSYGIGKTAICTVPAGMNQGIIAFHCDDKLREEYLYYYLNHIMDYIIEISGVSTFPEVSLTDIRNLKIPVPTDEHQEKVIRTLQTVDNKIIKEKETKQRLQELKRGLMQDLLTGKIRVNID